MNRGIINKIMVLHNGVERRVSIGSRDEDGKKVTDIAVSLSNDFLFLDIKYDDDSNATFAYNIKEISGFELYYKV